ncbi:MAG: hypothetical protein JNN01_11090 [Opitutaceae bacterium]|nr:hypothetical protein [Opitutaceae bacterium]
MNGNLRDAVELRESSTSVELAVRSPSAFPLLRFLGKSLPRTLGCEAPLADLAVVAVLHLYPDLLAFTDALVALGLDRPHTLFFHKPPEGYPYPNRDAVARSLRQQGSRVLSVAGLDLKTLAGKSGRPMLLIEDGGLIFPSAHTGEWRPSVKIIGAVD